MTLPAYTCRGRVRADFNSHNYHNNALRVTTSPEQVEDIPAALQQYSKARLPDAHAVCKMSENGFGKNKLQQTLFGYVFSC
jgi:2-polyprenyl-6-methoxyphenol hydroxylase-like FAD-dependent oxidoreductase